jgi:IS5 family transposase
MESNLVHVLDGVVDKVFGSLSCADFRGRPRVYGLKQMIKAFLLIPYLGLSSELDLVRYLDRNPSVRNSLGFDYLPHRTTFLRFRKRYGFLLFDLCEQLRRQLPQNRLYGVDATLEHKKDIDALWGYSKTKGWVNGFKFHILSDLKLGLPIRVLVTPANKHDSTQLPPLVCGIGLGDYVMDAGYDSETNHRKITQEGGFPAICRNNRRGNTNKKTLRNQLQKSKKRKKLLKQRWRVEPPNEQFKSILQLPTKLFRGIQSVFFYAQLTLLRLLTQAHWAIKNKKPQLMKVTTLFKHR